jgi:hypothetical protein
MNSTHLVPIVKTSHSYPTRPDEIRAVGNGASYLKGMCAQYGLRRLERACEDTQDVAWNMHDDQANRLSPLIGRLSNELDIAWDWFLEFFSEKGVRPTKVDVARWLEHTNGACMQVLHSL